MKKSIFVFLAFAIIVFISSCSDQSEKPDNDSKSAETTCVYTLINDSSAVNWTAFKTNDRIGVSGHFDEVKVWLPKNVNSPKEALAGTSFDIATASVNSGNAERDPKLLTFFFNTLKDGHIIKGEIKTAEGNDIEGKGHIKLMFNGVSKNVKYTYRVSGNKIYLKTGINLDEWDGSDAVKSLNTECHDLHIGKDGKSKLWPDIEIEVIALLNKEC